MLGKKRKGPITYTQWTEAFDCPLTVENAEYLRRGELKDKKAYGALFNRLSDYVTDTLDAQIRLLGKGESALDTVYNLRRFGSMLKRLMFFTELSFIARCDRDALYAAVKASTMRVLNRFDAATDAETAYELGVIGRIFDREAKTE